MTFKKGQSGNPKGRQPKGIVHVPRGGAALSSRMDDATRMDGWSNIMTALGTKRDKRVHSFFMPDIVTDVEALNLWRSEWMCRKVIEAGPSEAFRRGIRLKVDDKKLAEDIMGELEELGTLELMVKATQFENAFGGAAILLITNDTGDMQDPLDEAGITNLSAMHLFEPRELWPMSWYTDITSPKFGQPEVYRLQPLGQQGAIVAISSYIHESRLVIFPGKRISRQFQPGQRLGWGDSILSSVYAVIRDYGSSWGHAANMLESFGQGVMKLDGYDELMKDLEGEAIIKRRLALMETMMSSMRMAVVGKNDDFSRSASPIGGMAEILQEFALQIAAAADMPVTVLLGMAPAGLNATGDNDVRNWYDKIAARREHHYKCRLERIIKVKMLSKDSATGGTEPEVWSAEFPPLWEPTEAETATMRKTVAETDQIYYNIQAASSDDVAKSRWDGDTYSADMVIDWTARKKQQAIDAKKEDQAAVAMLNAKAALASGQAPPPGKLPPGGAPPKALPPGSDPAAPQDPAQRTDAYNPDQDRDEHGRFGSGGGGEKKAADKMSSHAAGKSADANRQQTFGPLQHAIQHEQAADAHGAAGRAHTELGDHATAAQHYIAQGTHESSAAAIRASAPRHGAVDRAEAATKQATTPAGHKVAAAAHKEAAEAGQRSGDKRMVETHTKAAEHHAELAGGGDKKVAADKASKQAFEKSGQAQSATGFGPMQHAISHEQAADSHTAAARLQVAAGDHAKAAEHTSIAARHNASAAENRAAAGPHPATTRAEAASKAAAIAGTRQAYTAAADAHHEAVEAGKMQGDNRMADRHTAEEKTLRDRVAQIKAVPAFREATPEEKAAAHARAAARNVKQTPDKIAKDYGGGKLREEDRTYAGNERVTKTPNTTSKESRDAHALGQKAFIKEGDAKGKMGYATAASAHERAAKAHDAAGNKDLAAMHRARAESNAAKAK